jgi:hypothetical protein
MAQKARATATEGGVHARRERPDAPATQTGFPRGCISPHGFPPGLPPRQLATSGPPTSPVTSPSTSGNPPRPGRPTAPEADPQMEPRLCFARSGFLTSTAVTARCRTLRGRRRPQPISRPFVARREQTILARPMNYELCFNCDNRCRTHGPRTRVGRASSQSWVGRGISSSVESACRGSTRRPVQPPHGLALS